MGQPVFCLLFNFITNISDEKKFFLLYLDQCLIKLLANAPQIKPYVFLIKIYPFFVKDNIGQSILSLIDFFLICKHKKDEVLLEFDIILERTIRVKLYSP